MTQATQHNFQQPLQFARARNSDPVSSKDAADRLEKSGAAKAQREQTLAALKRFDNVTSAELAHMAGLNRQMVARRLPELERDGLVRDYGKTATGSRQVSDVPCVVTGARCVRWRAA